MAGVKVRFPLGLAVIKDFRWRAKDKDLEHALNLGLDPLGPEGSDPDPDYTAAREAAGKLHGKILGKRKPEALIPGAIY